jgi:hypothetical protein
MAEGTFQVGLEHRTAFLEPERTGDGGSFNLIHPGFSEVSGVNRGRALHCRISVKGWAMPVHLPDYGKNGALVLPGMAFHVVQRGNHRDTVFVTDQGEGDGGSLNLIHPRLFRSLGQAWPAWRPSRQSSSR